MKDSQEKLILKRLITGLPITPLEALREFDCMRLAPRINDLRKDGWPIETRMVQRGKKRYAEYSLKPSSQQGC